MNRDEKFLAWCVDGAHIFSTCARRQFMAIVVDAHGRVIGTGYNGSPSGMAHCDQACPHLSDPPGLSSVDAANCIAIHAEANALMYSDHTERQGGTLYVNGLPCADCAKLIAGSGVARVVCKDFGSGAGEQLLIDAGIQIDVHV